MQSRHLTVVSAGLGQPSSSRMLANRLASAVVEALEAAGIETAVEVIELRDHAHDITNALLAGFPSAGLRSAIDSVVGADALVVVSPIFNASFSGLFKSFFDVLEPEVLVGKPVLIGATGGTARHSLSLEHALRPLFSYLRAIPVPTAVFAATEDWGGTEGGLALRIERAGGELAALVAGGSGNAPADPYDDFTPFERLLEG